MKSGKLGSQRQQAVSAVKVSHSNSRSAPYKQAPAKCHLGANTGAEMTRLSQCPALHDRVMKDYR